MLCLHTHLHTTADISNDNFSLIGPVVGGILGTVVFVLIVLVTVVLVVLLLRRKGTHKGV